jgi:universal stress protein A
MKIKSAPTAGRVVVELDTADDQLLAKSGDKPAKAVKLSNILVPIDFSACSKKALQYAIAFAKQFQARLTLLHVVQVNYAYGEFAAIDYPLLEKQMREAGEKQLAKLVAEETEGIVPTHTIVWTGSPASEIVQTAKRLAVDLIIISTHGYTGLKHVFLGSTTESVVRHAPCPVLTVRQHEHDFVTS